MRAADLPASAIHGTEWKKSAISDGAGGAMLLNPDKGAAKRETAYLTPSSYVEFTVNVAAGVPYRLWLRSRATNNSYNNDSLYVQFSGAVDATGAPLARIGTGSGLAMILEERRDAGVSGWGWSDSAYGTTAPPVYFAQAGPQKVRIQAREDGIGWDQLILSSAAFPSLPGAMKNDNTIVDEDLGTSTGVSPAHRYALPGTYPIVLTGVAILVVAALMKRARARSTRQRWWCDRKIHRWSLLRGRGHRVRGDDAVVIGGRGVSGGFGYGKAGDVGGDEPGRGPGVVDALPGVPRG